MLGKNESADTSKELDRKVCALSDDELEQVSGGTGNLEHVYSLPAFPR